MSERTLSVLDGSTFIDLHDCSHRGFLMSERGRHAPTPGGDKHQVGSYNPLGYRAGTGWPHKNSLIATGLTHYGHRQAESMLPASILRGPALRASTARGLRWLPVSDVSMPVAFPTASRPPPGTASTPLPPLSALLDLNPDHAQANIGVPAGIGQVELPLQQGPGEHVGR